MAENRPRTFVYVSHADTNELRCLEMDPESGRLTPLEQFVVPDSNPPSFISVPMAQSPDRRFLYVGLRSKPYAVATFRIDPTNGGLAYLGAAPLAGNCCYIAPDRAGRFLLVASYQDRLFSVSPIDPSGVAR